MKVSFFLPISAVVHHGSIRRLLRQQDRIMIRSKFSIDLEYAELSARLLAGQQTTCDSTKEVFS